MRPLSISILALLAIGCGESASEPLLVPLDLPVTAPTKPAEDEREAISEEVERATIRRPVPGVA
jgi:hypothetical protein